MKKNKKSNKGTEAKTETTATEAAPQETLPNVPVEPPTLMERATQLAEEVRNHKLVKDKSEEAVASRVARRLNSEGYKSETGKAFLTGAQVLALFTAANTSAQTESVGEASATG